MTAPTPLGPDLTLALTRLRQARVCEDYDLELIAENWLNRLLDEIPRKTTSVPT